MSNTVVDTSYRLWNVETLNAVRLSILTQMKAVEGVGQAHSANGRQTTLPDFDKLTVRLTSIEAALAWKANPANAGNDGYASRYASFGGCGE